MKKLLSLQNNKVTISPEALTLTPFKKIWDRDKSKDKSKALEDLSYVYWFADFSSIYSSLDENERHEALLADVYDNKRSPDAIVNAATKFYSDMQNELSPTLSFLEAAMFAANKIKGFFYSVDFSLTDDKGKPVYDISKVNSTLKEIGKTIDGLDQLKERVKRELQDENKIRGGVEKSMFEDPDYE